MAALEVHGVSASRRLIAGHSDVQFPRAGFDDNRGVAAQFLPLSIQEFHRLYGEAKPACEYWFGEAVQKPLPTILHGIVKFIIATLLERSGWNTSLKVRLKIVPNAEPVPDVIAVKGK